MNFNSKETYLAARAQWKANYAQLSADARAARRAFNEAQKLYSKAPTLKEDHKAAHAVFDARRARAELKAKAIEALEELQAAKQEAHRQWLAHTTRPV